MSDWYEQMAEAAEEFYDPEENDGREWDDLTDEERDRLTMDEVWDRADAIKDARKY